MRAEHSQALIAAAELRHHVEFLDGQVRCLQQRITGLQAEHAGQLDQ